MVVFMDTLSSNWQTALVEAINQNRSDVIAICSEKSETITGQIVEFEGRPLIERQVQVLNPQELFKIDPWEATAGIVAKFTSKIKEICIQQCKISDATILGCIGEIFRQELWMIIYSILNDAIDVRIAMHAISEATIEPQSSPEPPVDSTSVLKKASKPKSPLIEGLQSSKTIFRGFQTNFSEKEQQSICTAIAEAPTSTKPQTLKISVDRKIITVTFTKPSDKTGRISGIGSKLLPHQTAPQPFVIKPEKITTTILVPKSFLNRIESLLAPGPKRVPQAHEVDSIFKDFFQYAGVTKGTGSSHVSKFGITYATQHSGSQLHLSTIRDDLEKIKKMCVVSETTKSSLASSIEEISTPFGNFTIYHTNSDGNCLFSAIGYFLGKGPTDVRTIINQTATTMLRQESEIPKGITIKALQAAVGITRAEGRFGNENEARIAAIAFQRRVFVFYNTNYEIYQGADPGSIPQPEGWDAQGNIIDMNSQGFTINPGEDIVLYFKIDPSPDSSERHVEALM